MRKQRVLLTAGLINTNTRGLDYRMGKQYGVFGTFTVEPRRFLPSKP